MGRGVSCGGGQSSLGYMFGTDEAPKPPAAAAAAAVPAPVANLTPAANNPVPVQEPTGVSQPIDSTKQIPAGIHAKQTNNYFRADGQNTGNFITDRPSTKVHAAPGGGSSLGYLFGDGGKQ